MASLNAFAVVPFGAAAISSPERFRFGAPDRRQSDTKGGAVPMELLTRMWPGVSLRTVRLYLQLGVLPRPQFAGPATRYDRRHLVWLLAIRRLQVTEKSVSLASIRRQLSALEAAELEALATQGLTPGALADALGFVFAAPTVVQVAGATDARASVLAGPRWVRHELALGLELSVREDASPTVLEMVRQIRAICSA